MTLSGPVAKMQLLAFRLGIAPATSRIIIIIIQYRSTFSKGNGEGLGPPKGARQQDYS